MAGIPGIDWPMAAFRTLVVATQLATVALTWPLWQVRADPPLLPVWEVPQFSPGWLLVGTLVLVLAAPRAGTGLYIGACVLAMCLDQTRIQPQVVSGWFLLLATLPWAGARLLGRTHVMSLWFYSGFHKLLSPDYYSEVAARFWSELFPAAPRHVAWGGMVEFDAGAVFGLVMAAGEIALGVAAFFRPTRRYAAWGALLLHGGILFALSPLALNWNQSVWPWNVALGAAGWALFGNWDQSFGRAWRECAWRWRAGVAALLILPLGYYAGLVDGYLAHCLYSANIPHGYVRMPDGRQYSIIFATMEKVRAPLPPAPRLFIGHFRKMGEPGSLLEIKDPRWVSRLSSRQRQVIRYEDIAEPPAR